MLQRFAVIITVLSLTLTAWSHAQVVQIPDPNLRDAIRAELGINAPIVTQVDMLELWQLGADFRGIIDLTGLEYAVNLKQLELTGNPLSRRTDNPLSNLELISGLVKLEVLGLGGTGSSDISSLVNLTRLNRLSLPSNGISDISVLAGLTQLTYLALDDNFITDLSPLANLTNLAFVTLRGNRITDVRPLAGLQKLEHLTLEYNMIGDYSPLDGLALSHFTYDQSCDLPPEPVEPRLENRSLPSVP